MKTSSDGAKFIACREALVTVAYIDGQHQDGTPKYSIGFGSQRGLPQPDDKITIADAFLRLREDLDDRDITIGNALKVPVEQREWDAVASLFYQSGSRALSTVSALFNKGEPVAAIYAFAQFNRNRGEWSDGLTKRRVREMAMAIDGHYGDISQFAFFDGDPRKVIRQYMPFPEDI